MRIIRNTLLRKSSYWNKKKMKYPKFPKSRRMKSSQSGKSLRISRIESKRKTTQKNTYRLYSTKTIRKSINNLVYSNWSTRAVISWFWTSRWNIEGLKNYSTSQIQPYTISQRSKYLFIGGWTYITETWFNSI